MGIVKHTVEELASFLVELGMETTAHDAMVKELREAPLGSHKDLRSCGEYLWQLQKRRLATRVNQVTSNRSLHSRIHNTMKQCFHHMHLDTQSSRPRECFSRTGCFVRVGQRRG
jgi:hypothetical protein